MPTVARRFGKRSGAAAQTPAGPVVLMVSGGADSTALLLLACTSKLDLLDGRGCAHIARERLHVLHINHHLRGEASDGDEDFVRVLCERYGLPLCVEHASFDELHGQNLEAAARDVRYAAARRYVHELCKETGAPRSSARIVTAHTASDRTETFFMNAIKGSGPAGLSSIPRRRNIIVRPLIDKTHEDLMHYLEVAGQDWREDATNADTSYLRAFVRHKLLPCARERNGSLEHTVGSACDILGDEDTFLSQLAATALRTVTRRHDDGLMVLDGARLASSEVAMARRMVRLAVKSLMPDVRLEMRHVEGVLACVAAGEGSLTLPGGLDVRMEFGSLVLRTNAAREELAVGWLSVPGSMPTAHGCVLEAEMVRVPEGIDPLAWMAKQNTTKQASFETATQKTSVAFISLEALGFAPYETPRLWVDAPAPGDIMCPLGMSGRSKKLSDILSEARIPVAERPTTPVVRLSPGGAVVWLPGIRLDERFKCTPKSIMLVKLINRPVIDA